MSPQPNCPGVSTKAYRCQLGPGLAAVLTAAGQLLVPIVALAAGILWGGAVVLHPKLRALLQLGPLLIMALQVEKVSGSRPQAVDPNVQGSATGLRPVTK